MATHSTASAQAIGIYGFALAAGVVDTVDFDSALDRVRISNHDGVAFIYARLDGTDPVAGHELTYEVPPQTALELDAPDGVTVVKLISAGAPRYSVSRAL